jgi:hypothetical protein
MLNYSSKVRIIYLTTIYETILKFINYLNEL